MAAKKDKMIPSEKERKRALKYATPAGTGRMWVTMGIAFACVLALCLQRNFWVVRQLTSYANGLEL
jgi:hypothetical protein